jgi:hypothetical protein
MSTAATDNIIVCINCPRSGGRCKKFPPEGWTRVREFPQDDDETLWFTHVGYCPNFECQEAASEESKSAGLLFG